MPKKLTREEAQKLGLRPFGKKHAVRVCFENMEKSDINYVTVTEFKWKKKTPSVFIKQITKVTGKKFKIHATRDKLGWVVERVE